MHSAIWAPRQHGDPVNSRTTTVHQAEAFPADACSIRRGTTSPRTSVCATALTAVIWSEFAAKPDDQPSL